MATVRHEVLSANGDEGSTLPRRLASSTSELIAAAGGFGALAAAVGFTVRTIQLRLVDAELPVRTLVMVRGIRELTVDGILSLLLFAAIAGSPVFVALAIAQARARLRSLQGRLGEVDGEVEALREEIEERDASVKELRHDLDEGRIADDKVAEVEALLRWADRLPERWQRVLGDARRTGDLLRQRMRRPVTLRPFAVGVVVGHAVQVWFVDWIVFVLSLTFSVAGVAYVHWRSRHDPEVHPIRHLWPVFMLAAVGAVVMTVTQARVGDPGMVQFQSELADLDGAYASIERDDTYTYLWQCDIPHDARLLAIQTDEIRRIEYASPTSGGPISIPDLVGGERGPIRPTIDCGQ